MEIIRTSTVKLEIEKKHLFALFNLLIANNNHDLVQRYIVQLRNEEYISTEEAYVLATHYGVMLGQI